MIYTYIAFLRGINVGGHHKVPMAELKVEFTKLGYSNIITLLNSGNVIFNSDSANRQEIESRLTSQLETKFGFPFSPFDGDETECKAFRYGSF